MASETSAEQNSDQFFRPRTRQTFEPAPYQALQKGPLYRLERLYVPQPP